MYGENAKMCDIALTALKSYPCCTHVTLYTRYIVHTLHCTHDTLYTRYIVHTIHCTHVTLYRRYIVHTIHCTHDTLYTRYIVHTIHCTHFKRHRPLHETQATSWDAGHFNFMRHRPLYPVTQVFRNKEPEKLITVYKDQWPHFVRPSLGEMESPNSLWSNSSSDPKWEKVHLFLTRRIRTKLHVTCVQCNVCTMYRVYNVTCVQCIVCIM